MLVAGKGNGYLEFSPLKSSAVLGSFTYRCLSDPKNCNEQLTISVWVRLNSLQYVSTKEKFRFLGTEFGSVQKEVGLEFFYVTEGSKSFIFFDYYILLVVIYLLKCLCLFNTR